MSKPPKLGDDAPSLMDTVTAKVRDEAAKGARAAVSPIVWLCIGLTLNMLAENNARGGKRRRR